jgi:hypothetical protein
MRFTRHSRKDFGLISDSDNGDRRFWKWVTLNLDCGFVGYDAVQLSCVSPQFMYFQETSYEQHVAGGYPLCYKSATWYRVVMSNLKQEHGCPATRIYHWVWWRQLTEHQIWACEIMYWSRIKYTYKFCMKHCLYDVYKYGDDVTEEYQDGEHSYCEFFGLFPFLQLAIHIW